MERLEELSMRLGACVRRAKAEIPASKTLAEFWGRGAEIPPRSSRLYAVDSCKAYLWDENWPRNAFDAMALARANTTSPDSTPIAATRCPLL